MGWFFFLELLLQGAVKVLAILQEKQLLEAGKAQVQAAQLKGVLDNVRRSKEISEQLMRDPEYAKRMRDKYTRPD